MKQICTLIVFVLAWQTCRADLGAAPIASDSNTQIQTFANYTVQRHKLSDESQFVEYVDNNNFVFAVSWDGSSRPDMAKLMGNYFFQFQSLLAKATSLNGITQLDSSSLVIQSSGHMRSFFGLAYLPPRLPADFSAATIGR